MWRRVGRADFKEARRAVFGSRAGGGWIVFDTYEIREGALVATPDLVRGLERGFTPEDDEGFAFYNPLENVPDLFLKFARLHEEADFESAALRFAHEYGLPDGERPLPNPKGVGIDVEPDRLSLPRFREEARRAWVVLALYEAVLNGAAQRIGSLFVEHGEGEPFEGWATIYSWVPPQTPDHRNFALAAGLRCAAEVTELVVQRLCRQEIELSLHPDVQPGPSSCTGTRWTYDNLLGAMYLQMYWLLLSGADLARCENCGSPIPLHRTRPGHRKPPKHKRFCNDTCRQANHRSKKKT